MLSIFQNPDQFPFEKNSVVTLGSFDGIHFGHQLIIKSIIEDARKINGKSVLITFNPHPQEIIQRTGSEFSLLTTLSEKIEILQSFELDKVLVIPFTREFSELSAATFIEQTLLKKVGLKKITIGYDHMFGHNRTGSFSVLHQYGEKYDFEVEVVQAQQLNCVVVSSSKIRKSLSEGDVKFASELLGREYSVIGLVRRGDGIGHKIGFPTANIHIDHPNKMLPKDGVYFVKVKIGSDSFFGMCNLGYRPTFSGSEHRIEVNIFDFGKDIYGSQISVQFIDRIRDEKKFSSVNDLIDQLNHDKQQCSDLIRLQKL